MKKNNSRAVGHTYERQLRLELIELGWDKCQTSRYASRETDDANVDYVNTKPFNIQAKRWKSAPSYHDVLKSMPQDSNYNVIIPIHPLALPGSIPKYALTLFFIVQGFLICLLLKLLCH